jgi:hypothetical protein
LLALLRLQAAFAREPELERWFERGRVSLDGARQLSALWAASGVVALKVRRVAPHSHSTEMECGATRR